MNDIKDQAVFQPITQAESVENSTQTVQVTQVQANPPSASTLSPPLPTASASAGPVSQGGQTTQQVVLIERINRIVRDQGDVELFMKLDQIMDRSTQVERAASLAVIVKEISSGRQKKA